MSVIELHNDEIEKGCLGSILIDGNFYPLVARRITDKDFFFVRNQIVFRAMKRCWNEFGAIDSSLVLAKIMEDEQGRTLAGDGYPNHAQVYLYSLLEGMISSYYAETYALMIKRYSVRRALLVASENIAGLARDIDLSVEDVLSSSVAQVRPIAEGLNSKVTDFPSLFDAYFTQATSPNDDRYIPTPYASLNQALGGGVRRGNFTVLTGVPGSGKSMIACQYAGWLVQQTKPDGKPYRVGFYSIEMQTSSELMPRVISSVTRLTINECEKPSPAMQAIILDETTKRLLRSQLFIDDSSSMSTGQIRLDAEIHQFDFVIIDYAQKIQAKNPLASEYEQYRQIATDLKALAKDTQCAILLLAQMNTQGQTAKAGALSQATIRGSRIWNEEADRVIIITEQDGKRFLGIEKSRFSQKSSANDSAVPTLKPVPGTAHYEDLGLEFAQREQKQKWSADDFA